MKLFSMQFAKVLRIDTILCTVMLVFLSTFSSSNDAPIGQLQPMKS